MKSSLLFIECILSFLLVFSQDKVTKTVADISVSDTKLHITYSDGTSKDMDMPPTTSLRLPLFSSRGYNDGYIVINKGILAAGDCLAGEMYDRRGTRERDFNVRGWPRNLNYDENE